MTRIPNRPKCITCGKPLVRKTWPAHVDAKIGDRAMDGNLIVEILHRTAGGMLGQGFAEATSWSGHWGRYGDDRFCGLNCGYRWACNRAKPAAGTRRSSRGPWREPACCSPYPDPAAKGGAA